MHFEKPNEGLKREVRHVLMINSIKLVLIQQIQEIRELRHENALVIQQKLDAIAEIVEILHVRDDICRNNQLRFYFLLMQFGGKRRRKKRIDGIDALHASQVG